MNDIDYGSAKSITYRIAIAGFILAILVGALLASGGVSQIAFAFAASFGSQQIMLCLMRSSILRTWLSHQLLRDAQIAT